MSHDTNPIPGLREAFAAQADELPAAGPQPRYRPRTHSNRPVIGGILAGVALIGVAVAVAVTNLAGPDPTTPAAGETVTVLLAGHEITVPAGAQSTGGDCSSEGSEAPLPEAVRLEDGLHVCFLVYTGTVAQPAGAEPVTIDGASGWTAPAEYGRLVALEIPGKGYTLLTALAPPSGTISAAEAIAIVDGFELPLWSIPV